VVIPGPRESYAGSAGAQLITLDRSGLAEPCRKQAPEQVELILSGLDIVLGR